MLVHVSMCVEVGGGTIEHLSLDLIGKMGLEKVSEEGKMPPKSLLGPLNLLHQNNGELHP